MWIAVCRTREQEAELVARLSFAEIVLGSTIDWRELFCSVLGLTKEEGLVRRKELLKSGLVQKVKFDGKTLFIASTGQKSNAVLVPVVAKTVKPLVESTPYIARHTMDKWNEMARSTGLSKIGSVGGARLAKLKTRFKECIGKPESIWEEVIDGITSAIRKNKALANSTWLSYDYVIRSQETFDKTRQGRLEIFNSKREESSSESVPSYLRRKS